MDEFLAASFSYPTIVFTTLLGVAIGFWLLTIVGAVGSDALEFDGDADFDADMDVDADANGEGLGDAAAAVGFWKKQPLRLIPITVGLSLFFFFGWLSCHITSLLFAAALSKLVPTALWGSGVLLACGFGSLALSNLTAIPLAPIFKTQPAARKRDLIGQVVEIRTGKVDEAFGTAEAEDGGAGLLVEVRCAPDRLQRGDKALVINYNRELDHYDVEPLEDALRA